MITNILNNKQNLKIISQININCNYYNCKYVYNYIKFNNKVNINEYNNLNISVCEKCGIHIYEMKNKKKE